MGRGICKKKTGENEEGKQQIGTIEKKKNKPHYCNSRGKKIQGALLFFDHEPFLLFRVEM